MKRKGLFITLIVIAVFVFSIFALKKGGQKPIEVKTAKVEVGDIVASFSSSGVVESKNKKEYYALNTGKVLKVYVKESDKVKKGDILIEFEVQDMSNQLKTAQLQYENAKIQLENLKKQKENALGTLPQSQSLSIDDQIKLQENQVEMAKINVENIKQTISKQQKYIRAEADGVVTQINVKEGAPAPMQLPALIVENLSNLRVLVNINQYDVNKIKEGQEAYIKFLENTLKGRVASISKSATKTMSASGSDTIVKAYVDLIDTTEVIKPNFDVDVEIKISEKKGVLKIPNEALIQDKENRVRVFVVENGIAKNVDIKIGLQNDFEAEVISGLKEGDRVILNPPATLKDGVKVMDKDVKR
ncbi:MAG: efflux transporter, family, subunit [Caloramator sp.]|jgi:HlyD family secretion protein|uniref:efflux RND transporter periplasmic adaptor subunit n=1 Tax=Caloramator sp. TaxID=1871330 RepID=UPI001D876CB3|nr:efflux RND transporter periplasmic adaptor subunit [Caloramator sp.]MBZ4664397.1 efflux transporter, family, subunit [Caloramator sp.]